MLAPALSGTPVACQNSGIWVADRNSRPEWRALIYAKFASTNLAIHPPAGRLLATRVVQVHARLRAARWRFDASCGTVTLPPASGVCRCRRRESLATTTGF